MPLTTLLRKEPPPKGKPMKREDYAIRENFMTTGL